MTRLRALWHNILATYWFYPALFSLAAVALALSTVWLDRHGWSDRLARVPWLVPAQPEGASNMLTVIAGSMIAVASTVFSITIAAVAYASGNYGPRLLTNFMEDRGNQFSLATFIGTFVYTLIILRTVRMEDEPAMFVLPEADSAFPGFVPQLSLLTAFVLSGISVAVLVYFLNHVPASIRINSVLHGIGERLLKMVEHRFPDCDTGAQAQRIEGGEPVRAREIGYVQLIDYEGLHDAAKKAGGRLLMAVRTGDFIHPDMVVARWCADRGPGKQKADPPIDAIHDSLALGSRRTPAQDVDFLIDELVEIGLRALSPGINDPFTAITALNWLGAATAEIGRRDLRLKGIDGGQSTENRVIPHDDDFDYYIARGFGALRSGVAANRIAAVSFLDALGYAATTLENATRRARMKREADLLMEQAALELRGPELDLVKARHVLVAERLSG